MASISTPSSIATFPYAQASSSRVPHITLGGVHGSRGKLAVAAVHGDGVWTYDIKTLRPVTSFTVPPSTVFGSAPVSFIPEKTEGAEESTSTERVTAVVVQEGEGVKNGRAIWLWQGDDGEKKSVTLDTPAHSVHHLRGGWPLIVIGTTGGISAVAADLKVSSLLKPKPKSRRVIAAGIVDGLTTRAVLVDEGGHTQIYSLELADGRAVPVAEGALSSTTLAAADVGPDGLLTGIDTANKVHSRTVKAIVEGTGKSEGVSLSHPASPAAIVSLPSTSRPIAALAVPHPSPSVALVVPSPDLPAVLTSAPISTAASNTITHLAIIARPSSDHVILGTVLSHPGADKSGRSVIHIADVTLPAGGVGLALLVGSSDRTSAVFTKAGESSALQSSGRCMVDTVRSALGSGSGDAVTRAEKAFSTWLDAEDKSTHGRRAVVTESTASELLDVVFSAALKAGKPTGTYAAKIVQTLVDRRAVADKMYPERVLMGALVPLSDWRNVSRMLRTSPSLPSTTTVTLIAHSLKEGTPSLTSLLEDILAGPSPDPAYRAALWQQLDGPAALRVLEQLTAWAEAAAETGDGLDVWPERAPRSAHPPLAAIVAHSSLLLDAHLPTLMIIPEAEPVLVRMQVALAPALSAQQDYRRLRAPVDAALRLAAQAKKQRDAAAAAQAAQTAAHAATYGAAHGRKPRARVQTKNPGLTEEAVGKYRIEDIVF